MIPDEQSKIKNKIKRDGASCNVTRSSSLNDKRGEKRNVKRKLSVAHRSITYEVIMTDNNRDVCVSS